MRSKRLDLSEILKVGLSPKEGWHNGLSMLKNMKTDGSSLVGIPDESVYKRAYCIPFTLGATDYFLTATAIYIRSSGTPIYAYTFVGPIKIVNLIEVVWIQDSVQTLVVDRTGVSAVNPSGNTIPLCNSIVHMNGQILVGGILDGFNQLNSSYIGWSEISLDKFTLSKDNTAGFYNPNIGTVYNILPLQDSVVVLGSRGACQMYYAGHIFGFRDLDIPRLKSANLCASSTNICLYVAQDNSIVKVDKVGNFETLGFKWLGAVTTDIKYLNGRNLFVFTTADNSYCLDSKGMFSFGYKIWGELNTDLVVDTTFEQDSYEFKTCEIDFGIAGLKYLNEVYVADNLRSPAIRSVEVFSSGTAQSQGSKILNSLGATKYPIVGNTLSIAYAADTLPAVTNLVAEIQNTDRRFGFGYTPYGGQRQ